MAVKPQLLIYVNYLIKLQILIKEEDRLATAIEAIDYDVRIVPRGSYVRTSTGTVHVNRHFEGWY